MSAKGAKAKGKAWAELSADNLIAKLEWGNQGLRDELCALQRGGHAPLGLLGQAQQHAVSARDHLLVRLPTLHGSAATCLGTALPVSSVRALLGGHDLRGATLLKRAE